MTNLELAVIRSVKDVGRPLAEIAKEVGISRDALSKFVGGKAGLSSGNLGKLADYLNLGINATPAKPVAKPAKTIRYDIRFVRYLVKILSVNFPYFHDPIPPDPPFEDLSNREILAEVGQAMGTVAGWTSAEVEAMDDDLVMKWMRHLNIEPCDPHDVSSYDPETDEPCFIADETKDGEDPWRAATGSDPVAWLTKSQYRHQFRQDQRLAMLRDILLAVELPPAPYRAFANAKK